MTRWGPRASLALLSWVPRASLAQGSLLRILLLGTPHLPPGNPILLASFPTMPSLPHGAVALKSSSSCSHIWAPSDQHRKYSWGKSHFPKCGWPRICRLWLGFESWCSCNRFFPFTCPPLSCTQHRENHKPDLDYFLNQVTHVLQVQSCTRLFSLGSNL